MHTATPSYIVELPLRVNDQQNRFLEKAFEFGRTLYNATLGTALGRLQRMRETQEWRVARDMPKGKARTKAFSAVHKAFGLTEFGLTIIANNHRKASGRKDIGAHEAQSIGKAVWRALQRHMFQKAGRPRFKSFRRGLNSIEGTNNREIMYKPERGAIHCLAQARDAVHEARHRLHEGGARLRPAREILPNRAQDAQGRQALVRAARG